MKLSQLLDKKFTDALSALSTIEVDGKTALNISAVIDRALLHVRDYDEKRINLLKTFSEKNEDGSPKLSEDGKDFVIADTDGFKAGYEKLLDTEVEMNTLDLDLIKKLKKVTPATLIAIKPLIEQ